jgi:mannose-6-phosphate isomerase-like protein (cupin superfamily)
MGTGSRHWRPDQRKACPAEIARHPAGYLSWEGRVRNLSAGAHGAVAGGAARADDRGAATTDEEPPMASPFRLPLPCAGFAAAFAAGPSPDRLVPHAAAQSGPPPLTLQSLFTMTDEEIGTMAAGSDLRSRLLVATPDSTISVQSGNAPRHDHADANAIQLILQGEGSFWLGDRQVTVKPGDRVIIPCGVPHAGSRATTGRFRALAIKLPPQRAGDTVMATAP